MIKQIFPQSPERALIDMDHDHLLRESCCDAEPVKTRNSSHCRKERAVIGVRCSDHRRNVSVDQSPREHCALNIGQY